MDLQNSIEMNIASALNPLGLFSFGSFVLDVAPFEGKRGILIGNHAHKGKHQMFESLMTTPEFQDGKADPLNRWTKRTMDAFATEFGATVLYPFGEKVWPFQKFASQAIGTKPSPLGIFIHPDFGLWHAFRAVLFFDEQYETSTNASLNHPCDTCETKPCLSTCPVGAFNGDGLNVQDCFGHIDSQNDPQCLSLGCQARGACPVGTPYTGEQIAFHMKAYRGV